LSEEISANWLQSKYLPRVAVKAQSVDNDGIGVPGSGICDLSSQGATAAISHHASRKGAMAGTPLGHIHLVGCVNSGNDRDFGSTRAIKRCSKLALYCVFVWSELSQPDKDAKSISVSVWLALCHLTNSNSNSVIR